MVNSEHDGLGFGLWILTYINQSFPWFCTLKVPRTFSE